MDTVVFIGILLMIFVLYRAYQSMENKDIDHRHQTYRQRAGQRRRGAELRMDVRYQHRNPSARGTHSRIQPAYQLTHHPDAESFEVEDFGLLAYTDHNTRPQRIHGSTIPADTMYLRPYICLRAQHGATHRIRMAIRDGNGQSVFVDEDIHTFDTSRRTVLVTKTWLPMDKVTSYSHGLWGVSAFVDNIPLVKLPFRWVEDDHRDRLRNEVLTDGEISDDLRQLVESNDFGELSLSDLLEN